MKKTKLTMVFMVMTLICTVGVLANENSFYNSVEELLLLLQTDKVFAQACEQIKPMVLQSIQQEGVIDLTPEQVQIMEKYLDKLFTVIEEEMGWDKIKDDYIRIYMSVYTEEEVRELIEFYQSPVGQKSIEKMPMLMRQSMEISQKYMWNVMPRMEEIMIEMKAELESDLEQ
ncbi:MAG TPA: DUF2059 domain-containing protein [Bacillota bacterium]|nr:DUF2059 domain-containing protein [Bacillota bacterium]